MRVISKTGATSVEYPPGSGTVYEAELDGVFNMPENIANDLAGRHASHWALETAHEAEQHRQRTAILRSPHAAADTLTRHDSQLAALTARMDAIEARIPHIEQYFGELVTTDLEPAQYAPGGEQLAGELTDQGQAEQQSEDAGGDPQDDEQDPGPDAEVAEESAEEPKPAAKRTSPRKTK